MNRIFLYAIGTGSLLFFSLGIAFSQARVLDTDKIESQLAQMRDKFAQEEEIQLNQAASDAQARIQHITERADSDKADVPRYVYDANGHQSVNQDYDAMVNSIQTEAQSRIKDINDRLPKQQDMIRQNYQQKVNGLASSILNINSRLTTDKGGLQLDPAGSDLYVRNYSQTNLPKPPVVKASKVVPENLTR